MQVMVIYVNTIFFSKYEQIEDSLDCKWKKMQTVLCGNIFEYGITQRSNSNIHYRT